MCDCLFNTQIPRSTQTRVILRPASSTFVNGVAKAYQAEYPTQLVGYLSEMEFRVMIENINDMLFTYFPCLLCWTLGYLCCPFTLGISLCCPLICIRDAEEELRTMIYSLNRKKLEPMGMTMSLQKQCGTSWIEISLPSAVRMAEPERLIVLPRNEDDQLLDSSLVTGK